jgi:hypothetical protein
VDHSGEAEQVGLHMNTTKLLIWGRLDLLQQFRVPSPEARGNWLGLRFYRNPICAP